LVFPPVLPGPLVPRRPGRAAGARHLQRVQILCEAHLLPGALTRNAGLKFITRGLRLRVENARTAWTRAYSGGEQIVVPLKSGQGAYAADPATLAGLEASGQVVIRYAGGNPNGSAAGIAGICNAEGNLVGLMPHPEHAVDALTGPSVSMPHAGKP
jgi:phosphoribosylformylglycinamidine synthase